MSIKRTIITTVVALALVAVVAPGVTGAVTVADLQAQINALLAQLQALQGGTTPVPTGTGACAGVTFSRNLTVGSTGSDVKCLQVLLNQSASTQVATTGAGSPGNETTYFGSRTLVAVRAYQVAQGFTPANQVGPLTRARLNAALGGGGTVILPPPVQTGAVSAALSFDNPASGAIVTGQSQADLLHINFTGSGTVTSVTLQRAGISNQNTLSAVYLYDGNTRLTDGYSFNINGALTMNGLNIPVNGSKVISVKADVYSYTSYSTDPSSSIVVSLTGLTANGATMSANVMGNVQLIAPALLATAWLGANTYVGTTPAVNAGTSQYTTWSSALQINTRTVQLQGASFKMIGSAPTNALANIRLFVNGVDSGAVATLGTIQGSNYAMFNFATPISLTTGSHTIDVRADVVTGANRTMQLSLQSASDMVIFDPQIGAHIAVLGPAGAAFTANSGANLQIQTGSSTVVVDPTFASQTNITAGSTNAVIGKFTIHGYGEDVKVSSLQVTPLIKSTTGASGATCVTDASGVYSSGVCGLNNVTLYFNGSQVGSQTSWTDALMQAATPITFTLGSQMIIPAGVDSTLEVRADLQNASSANYTDGSILVTLEGDTDNAQGQSSAALIGIPPTTDVATTGLTISSASLVVSKNTSYANSTVNPNTTGARIGSYTVQNQSSSEAVRLTTLTVALQTTAGADLTASTTPALTNFSALRTSDTTGAGSTPIQPAASNTFSVNDVLQPGASMTIDIFANTASGASGSFRTQLTVASIGAVSNISSAGTAKTGQTITLGTGTVQIPSIVSSTTTPTQYIASSISSPAVSGTQATFNFVSTTAPSVISELKFTATGSDANPSQTVTQICVGSACGSPTTVGTTQTVYLTGLNLVVPTGAGLTQNVLVSYSGVGIGGIASNVTSTVNLTYVKYTSGGTTATITPTVAAPTYTLVGSVPTVTVANTSVSGLNYATAENKVGEVTIAASAKGSIKVNDIKFNVSSSNLNDSNAFTLTSSRIAVGSTTVTGSGCGQEDATSASLIVFCEFGTSGNTFATGGNTSTQEVNTDFDGYIIPAGSSVTFSLYSTVAGTKSTAGSTSTISTSVDATGFNWDDGSSAIFLGDGTPTAGTAAVNVTTDGTNLNGAGTTTASNVIANWPTQSYSIHD